VEGHRLRPGGSRQGLGGTHGTLGGTPHGTLRSALGSTAMALRLEECLAASRWRYRRWAV
jgi:hypothetical protein